MPSPAGKVKSASELALQIEANVRAWPFKHAQTDHKFEILEFAGRLARFDQLPFPEAQRLLSKPPINLNKTPREFRDELRAIRDEELAPLLRQAVDRHTAPFRALIFDVLSRFEALYNERKQKLGALDFNDLERRSIQLLRGNEAVRSKIRSQFRQIMLDEFQDVNEQQNILIDLVRAEDVFFAVGDVNQSIYGFRHARPGDFPRLPATNRSQFGKHSGSLFT